MRSSIALERASVSRAAAASRLTEVWTSASGSPRHSPSASRSLSAATAGSPALTSARAWSTRVAKRCSSTSSSAIASRYPGGAELQEVRRAGRAEQLAHRRHPHLEHPSSPVGGQARPQLLHQPLRADHDTRVDDEQCEECPLLRCGRGDVRAVDRPLGAVPGLEQRPPPRPILDTHHHRSGAAVASAAARRSGDRDPAGDLAVVLPVRAPRREERIIGGWLEVAVGVERP